MSTLCLLFGKLIVIVSIAFCGWASCAIVESTPLDDVTGRSIARESGGGGGRGPGAMIPDDLRLTLVDKLLGVPAVAGADPVGRTALLAGIPFHGSFTRNRESARGDVLVLVQQLEENYGADGRWRLLQLIDNSLPAVHGTELGADLVRIRTRLEEAEARTRPARVHPAEIAQVHLFDLRQPVTMCIGMLPEPARVSGFVIVTPTSRLLAPFCERLRQDGAKLKAWSRHQVATTGPPMVIDPRHTTVPVVLGKTAGVRTLLARKHVVWPIYVDTAADAEALWNELAAAFGGTLDHHLVITFGMPAGTAPPAGMEPLPPPRFTKRDISSWIGDIGQALRWPEDVILRWENVILANCAGDPRNLDIELVYEQLSTHQGLVTEHRTSEELARALDDLELIGGTDAHH